MVDRNKMTRRSLIAATSAVLLPTLARARASKSTPEAYAWPASVDLGGEIQLLDWRLSLADNGARFLAEIRNASSEALIAPTLGVVLPNLKSANNFSWANPFTPVIHPGESTFVVGLAPTGSHGLKDWETVEWTKCQPGDVGFDPRARLEGLDYAIESAVTVRQPDWMECNMSVANLGSKPIRSMRLAGIVRDSVGRICGGTPFSTLINVVGGDELEMVVNVRPVMQMNASPFNFIDDLTGGTASFSVQPPGAVVNQGCPAVMPWNREG